VQEKAVRWLRRAAQLAIDRYEVDDSLVLLHRAVEMASSPESSAPIWLEIGNANALKYDGEAFWTAMQRSLEYSTDPATTAKTYSDLAFQASIRGGMWKKHPPRDTVAGWVEQALELTGEETPERTRALIAQASVDREVGEASAREASTLADRLGDPELRSWAWMSRAVAAFEADRFEDALTWAQRRFDLEAAISDPDHLVELRESAMPPAAALGRLREVHRLAREHDGLTKRLSPHHRMHSVAVLTEVEELAGNWKRIRALEERVEQAVEANRDTPCVRNARCLLLCALARAEAGDEEPARNLESAADELGMEGHDYALEAVRIRLALARGDLDELGQLMKTRARERFVFGPQEHAARLDALAALRDRERVEELAPRFLQRRTYLEPFALRSLGIVREDENLIRQSLERFEALKLDWHAQQTRALR
jgi:hypothetical protein